MPSKKSAPKRKRAAPAPSGPKKKQSVAAKQKHVRELAKAGRWAEIERLYGKKMVAKAKIYAEKHGVTKTPQEIARDILLKNGYIPVAPQPAAKTAPAAKAKQSTAPSTRVNTPVVDLREQDAHTSSPETLTKEQQELIERRRRDALERRKRAQRLAQPPGVVQTSTVENACGHLRPTTVHLPEAQQRQHFPRSEISRLGSNRPPDHPLNVTHRVVTPDNLPTTNPVVETKQVRPEYFWDDLEAAAEIVQWENEHMAEVALEEPPAAVASKSPQKEFGIPHGQQASRSIAASWIPSISQELAAAAKIIQWENEHKPPCEAPETQRVDHCNDAAMSPNRSGDSSDSDLYAPQFQLLPVHTAEKGELQLHNPPEQVAKAQSQPSKKLRKKPNDKTRKRPLVATSSPALPGNNADSNRTTHSREGNPGRPALSPPRNQHDPTAEFIEKHLLDSKLELPVLEFLDMMLA